MPFKQDYGEYSQTDEQKLAFDLRVTNARMITIHWVKVTQSRHSYREWFTAIRHFYSILKHDVLESRLKKYVSDFTDLKNQFLKLINEHPNVYFNKSNNNEVEWDMQELLLKMEERLTEEITKSNMRGSIWNDEGGL